MSQEIEREIKVLETSLDDMRDRFPDLFSDDEILFSGTIVTKHVFHKNEDREFFFRMRQVDFTHNVELTIKNGKVEDGAKVSIEKTEKASYEAGELVFEALIGLGHEVKITKKYRTSYRIDDCRLDFDEYFAVGENVIIPEFMEIEAPSQDSMEKMIKKLSIDRHRISYYNFDQLLSYYRSLKTQN